ncbi:MAG: FAD-dependent oxidoreductase [bacterium]|nr:FAD-dependent oxidoreductase [bacterium]
MKIGIIGAGHAGVSAALTAAKDGAEVSLFSDEKYLPYFRPRIISVALGEIKSSAIYMHEKSWYSDKRIKLHLNTKITEIHEDKSILDENGTIYKFDKIIISTGSKPIIPPCFINVPQLDSASVLWTMDDALKINSQFENIKTLAIIGGGVIGIETALRAKNVGITPIIIEHGSRLLARTLTETSSEYVHKYLASNDIRVITDCSVSNIKNTDNGVLVHSNLDDLSVDFVVLAIGVTANISYDCDCHVDKTQRLTASENLSLDIPGIFAAGDNVNPGEIKLPSSVVKASNQGKIVADNVVLCKNQLPDLSPVALSIKYNDFELHALGKNSDKNNEEKILEETKNSYRSLIEKGNDIVGIQMFGTSKDFNAYKKILKID